MILQEMFWEKIEEIRELNWQKSNEIFIDILSLKGEINLATTRVFLFSGGSKENTGKKSVNECISSRSYWPLCQMSIII